VRVVVAGLRERDLVGAPGALDRQAVDDLGPGPALGGDQQDHRTRPPLQVAVLAGRAAGIGDRVVRGVERRGELAVYVGRVVALDGQHLVAVALEQLDQLRARDSRRHGRVGDLVAVEVQDREHRPVADRVDELVGVPGRGQWPGLELAVADHGGDQQVGVVHRGAVRVGEDVAELAALVDRPGRLRRDVAGDAAREGELAEELPHAVAVGADARVELGVGALQPGVRDRGRSAVAGTGEEDRVDVALTDQPVQVGVDEVEAGAGAPVAQ
jgi:hypothetical protein